MRTVLHRSVVVALAFVAMATALPARADGTQSTTAPMPLPATHIAIQGYDTVAYFTNGKPVKGSADIAMAFDGATWQFADPLHMAMFAADPDRYLPRYDGSCAGGMSLGISVPADPENWMIINGKLYLFAGSKHDVDAWTRDAAENIKLADEQWKRMVAQ